MHAFNDRRCVEQSLPIVITWKMYEGMLQAATDEHGESRTEEEQYIASLLKEACQEPLQSLVRSDGKVTPHWVKLTKRIDREVNEALKYNRSGSTAKQFIMCIRLVQHILEETNICLHHDSKFAKAMDIITTTLIDKLEEQSHKQNQHNLMEESASKAAYKIFKRLQARGLYV